jgi:hypothetical protein
MSMRCTCAALAAFLALFILTMYASPDAPGWIAWAGMSAGAVLGWAYGRTVSGRRR